MDIDILGIDLAKRVSQLHGANRGGSAKYGAKVLICTENCPTSPHNLRRKLTHV